MTPSPLRAVLPLLALLAALVPSACGPGDASGVAPDFTLSSPDGRNETLSAHKGRLVLLNFWATWCDSCKEELPELERLKARAAGDGFDMLAVSVDEDPGRAVPPFLKEHGLDLPVLYADRKTMDAYAVHMLPTTFLILPDGTIARRYVGPLDARVVENDILSLLKRSHS